FTAAGVRRPRRAILSVPRRIEGGGAPSRLSFEGCPVSIRMAHLFAPPDHLQRGLRDRFDFTDGRGFHSHANHRYGPDARKYSEDPGAGVSISLARSAIDRARSHDSETLKWRLGVRSRNHSAPEPPAIDSDQSCNSTLSAVSAGIRPAS